MTQHDETLKEYIDKMYQTFIMTLPTSYSSKPIRLVFDDGHEETLITLDMEVIKNG
jgi:hypothetical protein